MPRARRSRSPSPYLVNKAKREALERRKDKRKDNKWRGSTSTESGGDDDDGAQKSSNKGARKVAAMAAVKARMRTGLQTASDDVIDITDDTMHGPAKNPLSVIDMARHRLNADDIDKGLAFKPASFRSTRADKNKTTQAPKDDHLSAHDSAMFGGASTTVDVEGPLLPNQRTIDDVSNADTVQTLIARAYGPNAIHLPDYVFGDKAARQAAWVKQWREIRES